MRWHLACFAVNGTSKALLYNTSGMPAGVLGTFNGDGGRVIRDMLVNEVPMGCANPHLYVVRRCLAASSPYRYGALITGRLIGDKARCSTRW